VEQKFHFLHRQEEGALRQRSADADGITPTALLEMAFREAARKRGIHADSGIQTQNQPTPASRD
jgi:hypothetical protein